MIPGPSLPHPVNGLIDTKLRLSVQIDRDKADFKLLRRQLLGNNPKSEPGQFPVLRQLAIAIVEAELQLDDCERLLEKEYKALHAQNIERARAKERARYSDQKPEGDDGSAGDLRDDVAGDGDHGQGQAGDDGADHRRTEEGQR